VPTLTTDSPGDKPADWIHFREQMPVTHRWAYFDHAAVAPLPAPAHEALLAWAAQATADGDVHWPAWSARTEQLRRLVAGMIHAQPEEIALVRNTTEGINIVAEGFPWQPGDNVVTLADEFPSNLYAWLNLASQGVETRRVAVDAGRVDLDRLAAACDRRTRLITVSWVGYASGWRNNLDQLAELAHRAGALLFIDAIQAMGVFPLDVRRTAVDFLAADGHKWMLGPEGAGFFFTRREHLDRLRPRGLGWNSVAGAHDFSHIELKLKDTAARYEGGSQNMAGMTALCASLELLASFGAEAVARRILDVTDHACRRLAQVGAVIHSDRRAEHASGIVGFELPGTDPQQLRRRCLDRGVVLSCRGDRLRISAHAYNNADDIERLVEALTAPD
jgi:cysteine desulfurase / selenocysteine lyase